MSNELERERKWGRKRERQTDNEAGRVKRELEKDGRSKPLEVETHLKKIKINLLGNGCNTFN